MSEHRLDLERRQRLGLVEAVWGEHKSTEQIIAIASEFQRAGELCLITRVDASKALVIQQAIPEVVHHEQARGLTLGTIPAATTAQVGLLSGGSSDQPVLEEAELALRCHGIGSQCFADVGVAGLHRVLKVIPELKELQLLVAFAGMEGALPTVLAGLVPQPIIGVPVSVGYGVSAGGQAALNGMLASCAPGLTVVNIDNGYGAAMAALRVLRGRG
ncbi:MAG: circadian phase modifier CpmA [Synechococcus sp. TMED19]|nr:MAG: circadian phase modifier CpmA [Synechococcus sp. TMED19]